MEELKFKCLKCSSQLKLTGRGFLICPNCKLKHFLAPDGKLYIVEVKE